MRAWLAAAVAGGLVLGGCATTTERGQVGIERRQFLLLSSEEMNQGAALAYKQTLGQAQSKGAVNRDPEQVKRVRTIAARIIPHTAAFRKDAPGWDWEVNVISSPEVNAWCMPGGKIAFYTGILEKLKLTDAEVAAVMGHEIAHALREHGRERASQQVATNTVIGVGAAILGVGGAADLASLAAEVTLNLPNSRTQETEADRIGVELAARAGYDPRAAVTLWEKMAKLSGSRPPKWMSTHPDPSDRMTDLRAYAEKVMPIYQQSRQAAR